MDTDELKKLISQYTLEQLEACIQQQINDGRNTCTTDGSSDEIFLALSKAEVIRELMDQGLSFTDALRELGKRIRAVYGKG